MGKKKNNSHSKKKMHKAQTIMHKAQTVTPGHKFLNQIENWKKKITVKMETEWLRATIEEQQKHVWIKSETPRC